MDRVLTPVAEPRILFVTRKWAPAVGGMETYSMRLTEALGAIEPVQVVALRGRSNGMPPGVLSLMLFPFRVFAALVRRDRLPDVLHLGDMAIWPLALLPGLLFGNSRIVLSAHGTDVAFHRRGGLKGKAYRSYLRTGARLLSRAIVIANSTATAAVAAETGWRCAHIVPLATDLAGSAGDGTHDQSLLFVGRLVERKGCGWFVKSVLPLLDESIELAVAGPNWDEHELATLNNPKVRHLGSLQGKALADAYRSAMAVIIPNIEPASGEYEGFGLVAPEAAACGGIVLAARTGGLTDAVIDGVTGHLLPSSDAEAWANKIREIGTLSKAQRAQFLARSRDTAVSVYSWDRVARQSYAAYDLPSA